MANYILHVKGQHTDNDAAAGQWGVEKRVSSGVTERARVRERRRERERGSERMSWVVPLNIFYTPQIDRTIRGRRWPYGTGYGRGKSRGRGSCSKVGDIGSLPGGTRERESLRSAHRCATTINEIYSICTGALSKNSNTQTQRPFKI